MEALKFYSFYDCQVIDHLKNKLEKVVLGNFAKEIPSIENALFEYIANRLALEHFSFIKQGYYNSTNTFQTDKGLASVKVMADYGGNNSIGIIFNVLGQQEGIGTRKESIKFTSENRYNLLHSEWPLCLSIEHHEVFRIADSALRTGFGMIHERFLELICEPCSMTRNLYRLFHNMWPFDKKILNSMYFVCTDKETCRVLTDTEVANRTIERLVSSPSFPGSNPYVEAVPFLNMDLPFEKAFARIATNNGGRIDGKISQGKYISELPALAQTQIKVFSDHVTVYPISLSHDRFKLFLSFPTQHADLVLPIMSNNKEIFQRVFVEHGFGAVRRPNSGLLGGLLAIFSRKKT